MEKLHYVHSLYAYYALQFGVPAAWLLPASWACLMLSLYRAVGMNEEAQWFVKGALVSWIALAGSGLMLCLHSYRVFWRCTGDIGGGTRPLFASSSSRWLRWRLRKR